MDRVVGQTYGRWVITKDQKGVRYLVAAYRDDGNLPRHFTLGKLFWWADETWDTEHAALTALLGIIADKHSEALRRVDVLDNLYETVKKLQRKVGG